MPKDTILEDLKAYTGPKTLPPIADRAFAVYHVQGDKIDDAAADAIREDLARFAGDLKQLTDNIIGLAIFALYLRDDRKDVEGCERVVRIIGEHSSKYFPIGQRIVAALQDVAVDAQALFDQFSGGGEEKKRAPKFGEAGPAGSLPLKAIKPVSQQPPRPVRKPKKSK